VCISIIYLSTISALIFATQFIRLASAALNCVVALLLKWGLPLTFKVKSCGALRC
jgi:hypothetical protein